MACCQGFLKPIIFPEKVSPASASALLNQMAGLKIVESSTTKAGGMSSIFILQVWKDMEVRPAVVVRAILVEGVAAFAKSVGGAMSVAGVRIGIGSRPATTMTTMASTFITSKKDQ